MRIKQRVRMAQTFLIGMAAISSAQPALACSVCYGDPNSPMTKGVEAGVLVLLGFVGTVLLLIAALLLFWMRRASQLEDSGASIEEAGGAWASQSSGGR